jgi:hypothetical protein
MLGGGKSDLGRKGWLRVLGNGVNDWAFLGLDEGGIFAWLFVVSVCIVLICSLRWNIACLGICFDWQEQLSWTFKCTN